jgi:hypothetical protein
LQPEELLLLFIHRVPATFTLFFFRTQQIWRIEEIMYVYHGPSAKKWFHQFYNYLLVLSLSNGITMLVIPLYITYFHKYPADESQSSKDLIPNITDCKGMYYLNPSLPFLRIRDSSGIYFASAHRGC